MSNKSEIIPDAPRGDDEKIKTEVWLENYQKSLDELFSDGKMPPIEGLVEVVFQKGILDRINPLDEGVKKRRAEEKRYVFDGGRNDRNLYLRLLYASVAYRQGLNLTAAPSWIDAIGLAINRYCTALAKRGDKMESDKIIPGILDVLEERIRKEGGKFGMKNTNVMTIGTKFRYHGLNLIADGYTPSGLLRVRTESDEDWNQLFQYNKGAGISPETLDDTRVVMFHQKEKP